MIMQLPKSVFSYDVQDFMGFHAHQIGSFTKPLWTAYPPPKKIKSMISRDFSEFPEAIESTWVSPPSCRGCASCRKRTPELQSLANEHTAKQFPLFVTCILHRCVHLQFARI